MESKYRTAQRKKAIELIESSSSIFNEGRAGKRFMGQSRNFVLLDPLNNIFAPIRIDVVEYFKYNRIAWWGGNFPTGHVLSSQIACLNHLFHIRKDRDAVLSLLKNVSTDFKNVLPIVSDNFAPAFIQFESVSDKDHLNEGNPSRGNNCTSIDALIYAVHVDGSNWIIPIEWKYTEVYKNDNKAIEGCNADPINCKGEVRKRRYTQLINDSAQLKSGDHSCYYFDPFYQLMRQTLWAEQMIKHNQTERLKADNFLHVQVIPSENLDLLDKKYKCSGLGLEATWREHLKDQSKFLIISPTKLLDGLNSEAYDDLLGYLSKRYWTN